MKNQPPHIFNLSAFRSRAAGSFIEGARSMLGLMFPGECPGCNLVLLYPRAICENCASSLSRIRPPFCKRCGTPFPEHWTVEICAECRTGRSRLTRTRSVFLYEGLVRNMIRAAKFSRRIRSFRFFAEEAYVFAGSLFLSKVEAIVPVPMHRSREWERTYNQADLIAAKLSLWSGVPMLKILRKKKTHAQSSLSGDARRKNLRGTIFIRSLKSIPRAVLLIDDVITTGTTLEECARVLRQAGVKRVYALTIARTILNS